MTDFLIFMINFLTSTAPKVIEFILVAVIAYGVTTVMLRRHVLPMIHQDRPPTPKLPPIPLSCPRCSVGSFTPPKTMCDACHELLPKLKQTVDAVGGESTSTGFRA